MKDLVDQLLGLHEQAKDLAFSQMAARAVVVFCVAILLARLGDRRFMGRSAGYDFMLGIVLGSVLSRGINGQAPFFPTLGVSILLVFLHWLVGALSFHSHHFSLLVKGRERVLVANGKVNEGECRRNHITIDDLGENLRVNGAAVTPAEVQEARLERSGQVSVIKRRPGGA